LTLPLIYHISISHYRENIIYWSTSFCLNWSHTLRTRQIFTRMHGNRDWRNYLRAIESRLCRNEINIVSCVHTKLILLTFCIFHARSLLWNNNYYPIFNGFITRLSFYGISIIHWRNGREFMRKFDKDINCSNSLIAMIINMIFLGDGWNE
jgi:hypothetical protein